MPSNALPPYNRPSFIGWYLIAILVIGIGVWITHH